MMIQTLGRERSAGHERERGDEVGEHELTPQLAVVDLPVGAVGERSFDLCSGERLRTRHAGSVRDRAHR